MEDANKSISKTQTILFKIGRNNYISQKKKYKQPMNIRKEAQPY